MTIPLTGAGPSAGGIPYLLRDDFTDTLTAGNVNGTAATPGPGTRTVVDTGSDLTLSGGNLVLGGRTGNGDPGLWLDAVTRAAGVVGIFHVNKGNLGNAIQVGFDADTSSVITLEVFKLTGSSINNLDNVTIGALVQSRDYYFALVLKSTGAYMFIKESIGYPSWTLLWITSADATGTLYPAEIVWNAYVSLTSTCEFIRVPDETWLPPPRLRHVHGHQRHIAGRPHEQHDGAGLAVGGDGEGVEEESGDWDIQSNKANPDGAAIATVDAGQADVVVDLTVDGGTAGQPAICLRFADTSNYWFLQADRANNQFELHEYNATVDTVRANAAVTFNDSTDYDLRAVCDGQVIDGFADGANKISYGSAALNEALTEHGLYADHTECEYDDFLVFARDSGYAQLDNYIS